VASIPVYLEEGRTWTFAVALEWPGWCRRAKGADAALATLESYRVRYRAAVPTGPTGPLHVIGVASGSATTDFGAPDARGPWDEPPLTSAERRRQIEVLEECWRYFDRVVATSPPALRKGPRGGGRDRDAVADHVREAERAYASRLGARVAPRTPWPEQRRQIVAALEIDQLSAKWPASYALRRVAWHVLDHAWEIEDRAEGSSAPT
jgi:hypothetical protein